MSQVNPSHRRSVRSVTLREPLVVCPSTGLLDMLSLFQTGKSHLALVSEEPALALECLRKEQRPPHSARYLGIVTLEDVLERIIQEDIQDEKDFEKIRGSSSSVKSYSSMWHRSAHTDDATGLGSILISMPDYNVFEDDNSNSCWVDQENFDKIAENTNNV